MNTVNLGEISFKKNIMIIYTKEESGFGSKCVFKMRKNVIRVWSLLVKIIFWFFSRVYLYINEIIFYPNSRTKKTLNK